MTEDGVHTHAAHEHALEHEAQRGPGLAQWVAIFTALLATLGAVVNHHAASTQSAAVLAKNEAVLKKAEASDQWALYQSKSNKGHLMELALDVGPAAKHEYFRKQIEKYEREKKEVRARAESLDAEAERANAASGHLLHPLHLAEQGMTFIQVAISLASVTALTRQRWLLAPALAAAALGAGFAAVSFLE
jgi:hypothetical protein